MVKEADDQLRDRELTRAIRKAFSRVEKMYREEPRQIIISAEGDKSSSQIRGIATWLFHRRHGHGSSGN